MAGCMQINDTRKVFPVMGFPIFTAVVDIITSKQKKNTKKQKETY